MPETTGRTKSRDEVLEVSIPLFAKDGYSGVSMRNVAQAVGVTPAALYYHFSDKDDLYISVIDYACKGVKELLDFIISRKATPQQRLSEAITGLAWILSENSCLTRLIQWVLMDEDEIRMKKLGTSVFNDIFNIFYRLAEESNNEVESHQMAVSIISLVVFPYQSAKACRHLPGYKEENLYPENMGIYVLDIINKGLLKTGNTV